MARLGRRRLAAAAFALAAPAAAQAADDARAAEIVQGRCFICHGVDGESSSPAFPRLAGQHARYIERQLADYKAGRRKSSAMQPMVEELSPADFLLLGRYFEARRPRAHAVDDTELAQAGRHVYQRSDPDAGGAACATCHGADGAGSETLPRLAGQHAQYTENQLLAFSRRERRSDNALMHTIASRLSEHDRRAVAAYLSGLP